MLWLPKNTSLENVSLGTYLEILAKHNIFSEKILQYHRSSLVVGTAMNVTKIIHPKLGRVLGRNFQSSYKKFVLAGIRLPKLYHSLYDQGFFIFQSEMIGKRYFLTKRRSAYSDKFFLKLYNQLKLSASAYYGPVSKINERGNQKETYIQFWNSQFEYYFTKENLKTGHLQQVVLLYKKLRKNLRTPKRFILSHADIAPKHLFVSKNIVGCIDIEESQYLDSTFMPALWIARTFKKRGATNIQTFCKNCLLNKEELLWFKFHLFRELFIQQQKEADIKYFLKVMSRLEP